MATTEIKTCDRCGAKIDPSGAHAWLSITAPKERTKMRGYISGIRHLLERDKVRAREVEHHLMDSADLCKDCTTAFVRWFFKEGEDA